MRRNIIMLGGDILGEDRDTRERLLESAKKEFIDKGYMKASLRKICADAGVTTGALYFFFKDKEDLFTAIVGQPLAELKELVLRHFSEHEEIIAFPNELYKHVDGDHDDISAALIHHLYSHYGEFILLLTGAQGSRFENCVDEIVGIMEKAYRIMADNMARNVPGMGVNPYMLHWFTHMNIDAFIHLITHEQDEDMALANMKKIMDFLVKGWTEMILVPPNENLKK